MKKAADTLFLLATFSLRAGQIGKALQYSGAGRQLFPDDLRLIELHAHALLLQGDHAGAEATLSETQASTPNLEFLRGRTAILLDMPKDERRARLRRYLSHR
jgi:hypothetical protein